MLTAIQTKLLLIILLIFSISFLVYIFFSPDLRAHIQVFFRNLARQMKSPILPAPARLPLPLGAKEAVNLGWVGHSTWLIEMLGVTVLTDPVFSERIKGSRRLVHPAVHARDLKNLDAILLTHAHYDHLDLESLGQLPPTAPIIHPQGDDDLLQDLFQSKKALLPGQSVLIKDLSVTALPVLHPTERPAGLQNRISLAYLLEKGDKRLIFSGDTAYSPELIAAVRKRCPEGVDYFLVPISAYEPPVFQKSHCTPEEALHMGLAIKARQILPMHHHTFILSLEPIDEPLLLLRKAAEKLGVEQRLKILPIGGRLSEK